MKDTYLGKYTTKLYDRIIKICYLYNTHLGSIHGLITLLFQCKH